MSEDRNAGLRPEHREAALGAVDALEIVGSIDPVEAQLWRERIAAISSDDQPPSSEPPIFRGDRLLRVINLAPRETDAIGFDLQAVGLYGDGIRLHWVFRADRHPDPRAPGAPPLAAPAPPQPIVRDDVGTPYTRAGSRGSGDPLRGEDFFVPAVPPHASELVVKAGTRRINVRL